MIARTGPLPTMPPSVEVLDVSHNKFTGGIPSEWGSLTNLKSLRMVQCGIGGACVYVCVGMCHHTATRRANHEFSSRTQGRCRR